MTSTPAIAPCPKAVVRAYVDAFNRGDLAALRALLADDAVIQGVTGVAQDWIASRGFGGS